MTTTTYTYTKEELKAHRQELIKALRDGSYMQITSRLRSAGKSAEYCCLGVACELSNLGTWYLNSSIPPENASQSYMCGEFQERLYLPSPVKAYYGFPDRGGIWMSHIDPYWVQYHDAPEDPDKLDRTDIDLANLNDDGFTFSQIADIIEYYFWDEDH